MDSLVLGLAWYVVLLFSLTLHEAGHAWAAWRGGDPTAYHEGQVSLDPLPHIRREPMGTVLFPVLSFFWWGWMMGWASTPYDPAWARLHPRRAAWMSLAGPAANLLLLLLAGFAIRAGMLAGVFEAPASIGFASLAAAPDGGFGAALATLLSLLFTLNLVLFAFNLIPVPPLDGSSAISLLLSEGAARRLQEFYTQPGFALGGLVVAWLVFPRLFGPLHLAAINLLYPGLGYH